MKIHGNVKNFQYDHCRAAFVLKLSLVRHMWVHRSEKRLNCTQCNRGFNGSDKLKNHIRSHSENPRPFQCDLCPKNYPTKEVIKNHLLAVHSNQTIKCDTCSFSTKTTSLLISHKKIHLNQKSTHVHFVRKNSKLKQTYEDIKQFTKQQKILSAKFVEKCLEFEQI
jgi:KRAB domain-containing zinc finger protein